MTLAPVTVRRVTDPHDPALREFGRIQQSSYYAPQSLIPPEFFPQLLKGVSVRKDRILVASSGSEVVGGTVYSLLPRAGFNSFMGVSQQARGQGVGRALQRFSLEEVRQAGLPGMFADSVYAQRQSQAEREAEQRVGTDPHERRRVLGALGFFTVDIAYWQPIGGTDGSADGGPLADLDLLYCPLTPTDHISLELVTATLQAYWQDWLGPERAQAEVKALAQRHGQPQVRLLEATQTPGYWSQAMQHS